jgi:hypothetical protein
MSQFPKKAKKKDSGVHNDASSEDEVLFKRVEPAKEKKAQENTWELGGAKRATILEFKGKRFIDIREYYEKNGEMLPGKKGICLNFQQFEALLDHSSEIKAKYNSPKQ